jgi:hypothetical protein
MVAVRMRTTKNAPSADEDGTNDESAERGRGDTGVVVIIHDGADLGVRRILQTFERNYTGAPAMGREN